MLLEHRYKQRQFRKDNSKGWPTATQTQVIEMNEQAISFLLIGWVCLGQFAFVGYISDKKFSDTKSFIFGLSVFMGPIGLALFAVM